MWEAGEETNRECTIGLHFLGPQLKFSIRKIVGSLAHYVRQHRVVAPGHGGTHLIFDCGD